MKIETHDTLKIAIISDIHLGGLIECRPGAEAPALLKAFVDTVNKDIKPDIVVDLGDRVNNHDHADDVSNLNKVKLILDGLHVPSFSILGNHDTQHIGKNENLNVLGLSEPYYSMTIKGFKLIFLNTADPVFGECGGAVSTAQLSWLQNEISSDSLPKIVFGHHPIAEQNQEGNPFFVKLPGQQYVKNRNEVRSILTNGQNVFAYFNGHVHWFYSLTVDNLPCISIPSLLESWPETSHAPGHYGEALIGWDGHISVSIRSIVPTRVLGRFELGR